MSEHEGMMTRREVLEAAVKTLDGAPGAYNAGRAYAFAEVLGVRREGGDTDAMWRGVRDELALLMNAERKEATP